MWNCDRSRNGEKESVKDGACDDRQKNNLGNKNEKWKVKNEWGMINDRWSIMNDERLNVEWLKTQWMINDERLNEWMLKDPLNELGNKNE